LEIANKNIDNVVNIDEEKRKHESLFTLRGRERKRRTTWIRF